MKTGLIKHTLFLLLFATLNPQLSILAQGTAFTYQGQLLNSGSPAGGLYDFRFRLDADPAGNTILATVFTNAIPVTNGLFTTTIDFGAGLFNGSNYWLEVAVRTNTGGSGTYTALNPLQPLTPAPYAVFANTAGDVSGGVSASQLTSIGNTNGGTVNFFVGPSGNSTTSGSQNTANGNGALHVLTTGSQNTADGNDALLANSTGSHDTATGNHALAFNGTGSLNTADGDSALYNNQGGSQNTAVGYQALFEPTSGMNNIAVGYQAGITTGFAASNNIDIGNAGVSADNNTIRIGTTGIQTNTFIAGVINGNGAGLTSLNASQLTSIGNTNGGVDNVFFGLAGNSAASGDDNTGAGLQALSVISSGQNNTAYGFSSLYLNASGSGNTAFGSAALQYNGTGSFNTAIGAGAFAGNYTFSGSNNIALGYQAGYNVLSGNFDIYIGNAGNNNENNTIRIGSSQTNTFIAGVINGNGAGLTGLNVSASQLTSIGNTNGGVDNFFIGNAGNSAVSGSDNTGAGLQALSVNSSGQNNTAYGFGALYLNATGSDNTAIGYEALQYNMGNSSFNTAIGAGAFAGNYTFNGSNNIALGYQAGYNVLSGNFDIYIGNAGNNNENNTIRIGSSQTNTFIAGVINGNGAGLTGLNAAQLSGSVPVGVSVPATSLTGALPAISGASLTSLNAGSISSGTVPLARLPALNLVNVSGALPSSTSYTVSGNTTGGINSAVALVINNNTSGSDAPALRVMGNGAAGSGVLSVSSQNPQLTGLIAQFGNSNAFVVSITNDGTIYCKATMLSSDRNVKENFQALDVRSVLDKLAAMPVTEWNYKDDAADRKHIGPMAQDFYAAFRLDGNDDRHISTVDEGGVALAAIQGLNQKLEEKDARLLAQASEIAELKTRLEKLERLMTEKMGGAK